MIGSRKLVINRLPRMNLRHRRLEQVSQENLCGLVTVTEGRCWMVAPDSGLKSELWDLEQQWEQITDVPETPRSLMNVVEYGLGSNRRAEVYINRLLRYFLDPEEPHGLQREFLKAFLNGLPDECAFDEDTHDLSSANVDEQVYVRMTADENPTGDTERTGSVDLVLEAPNEWFLMTEIKFWAGENNVGSEGLSQTEFYYEAPRFGGQLKEEYESGYYIYMYPSEEPEAEEDGFTNWTWESFLDDVFWEFLRKNSPRYPQRTVAQLREFNDDVEEIANMTDQQANQREKIELYLEHYDAIKDVSETFDTRWETFTDEWGNRLGETLETEGEVDLHRWNPNGSSNNEIDRQMSACLNEVEDPGLWSFLAPNPETLDRANDPDLWVFRAKKDDWAHVFKYGWWKWTDGLADRIDSGGDDVRIGFHHRLGRNRDLAVGDHTLKFYFRNMGGNEQDFIDEFCENFYQREKEIDALVPPSAEVTGNKRNMIKAKYGIPVEHHDTFFEAYIAALKQAFVEHIAENEELVTEISSAYDESLDMYRENG